MKFAILIFIFLLIISFQTKAQPPDSIVVGEKGVFDKVDIEAKFQGGEIAWRKFLEQNLRANVPVDKGAPMGAYTVWVQFIVNKEGKIEDVKALTNYGYGMEQEVSRIIKIGPDWMPASQNGRYVKAYRKQPVTFVVEDDDVDIRTKDFYTFYVGQKNPMTISVRKVKSDNLDVRISNGTISGSAGNYIVTVNEPGSVFVDIYNTKNNQKIKTVHFEVRKSGAF